MHDIRDQISASRPAPDEVTPLDMESLVRRARRGTMVTRSAATLVGVLVLAGGAVLAGAVSGPAGPDIVPLTPDSSEQPAEPAVSDPEVGDEAPEPELEPAPTVEPEPAETTAVDPPARPQPTPASPSTPQPPAEADPEPVFHDLRFAVFDHGYQPRVSPDFEIWVRGHGSCFPFRTSSGMHYCEEALGSFAAGELRTDDLFIYPAGRDGDSIRVEFVLPDEFPASPGGGGPRDDWFQLFVLYDESDDGELYAEVLVFAGSSSANGVPSAKAWSADDWQTGASHVVRVAY